MLLKEHFKFLPKSKIKAGESVDSGKYPFFTSSDIKVKRINEFIYDDELLILGTGGVPSCNYYNGKFAVSTDNFVLKTLGDVKPKFLYYFLRLNNLSILKKGFKGSGLQHISKTYVEYIKIPILNLNIQEKIITNLDKINLSFEVCKNNLMNLDELIKSRFIEMFKVIDLSNQNDEWVELGKLSKIYTGTTPSTSDESNWNGNILWVTPAEMSFDSKYIYDTERKITDKGKKSKSLELMPINTILLTTRAPIGKVGIVGTPMTCNQGFKNFYFSELINPLYAYMLLLYNKDYLNSLGTGTTFMELSKSKVEKIKIPVPPLDLQNEFADFVDHIDKLKFNIQKRIDLYQELLDKKMDEYFG